jgi:UDP:flavonoid glycosyltransferase YjiC (YdhE family)
VPFVALAGHARVTTTLPLVDELVRRGRRVVELGLGERLATDTLSPDAQWQAVSRVTVDEQVRANLERVRRTIRDAGRAERGAALIEDHLT